MGYLINWLCQSLIQHFRNCFDWFYNGFISILNIGYRVLYGLWELVLLLIQTVFNVIFWTIDGCLYLTVQSFKLVFNEGSTFGLSALASQLASAFAGFSNLGSFCSQHIFIPAVVMNHLSNCFVLIIGFYCIRFVLHFVRG